MKLFPRLVCAMLLLPNCALAWHEGGHIAIAQVAWRKMTPQARSLAERLAKIGTDARTNSFLTLSVWADDYKNPQNGPWHYRDHFFRADGKPAGLKPDKENAVWAMEKFTKVLGNKKASDADRAEALRFIVHIAGDLHQPLHCVARVTDEFPKGDRGGNDFRVTSPDNMDPKPRNLHFYWDMGGGLFGRIERPLSPEGQRQVATLADAAEAALPWEKNGRTARNLDFGRWTQEGLELCKKQLYNLVPGAVPSPEYQAACQKLSLERVALAGYRLGNLLNRLMR